MKQITAYRQIMATLTAIQLGFDELFNEGLVHCFVHGVWLEKCKCEDNFRYRLDVEIRNGYGDRLPF
jgi:hypothetical protein